MTRLARVLLALAPLVLCGAAPHFVALDDLPGDPLLGFAYDISQSGDRVVGEGFVTGTTHGEGVVWERKGSAWRVRGLGTLPSDPQRQSPAFGISRNDRIVGYSPLGDPAVDMAYLWKKGKGLTQLGLFPGDKLSFGRAISLDGKIVVGWGCAERTSRFGTNDPYRRALYWMGPGSPMEIDTAPDKPVESLALTVTNTGSAIAGFAVSERSVGYPLDATRSRGHEAIVWTRDGGGKYHRRWLGFLPGHNWHSMALDITAEGDRIVGSSGTADQVLPVVWDLRGPSGPAIRDLGVLPGYARGEARSISADGKTIVGSCNRGDDATFEAEAFVWDELNGMRSLKQLLLHAGIQEVEKWTLVEATGVSADGSWVCGHGTTPAGDFQAWVVRLK